MNVAKLYTNFHYVKSSVHYVKSSVHYVKSSVHYGMFSMYDVLNIIHNPTFVMNNVLWLLCYYKLCTLW